MQALALLFLTLPEKYDDVCNFLNDRQRSGSVPAFIFVDATLLSLTHFCSSTAARYLQCQRMDHEDLPKPDR